MHHTLLWLKRHLTLRLPHWLEGNYPMRHSWRLDLFGRQGIGLGILAQPHALQLLALSFQRHPVCGCHLPMGHTHYTASAPLTADAVTHALHACHLSASLKGNRRQPSPIYTGLGLPDSLFETHEWRIPRTPSRTQQHAYIQDMAAAVLPWPFEEAYWDYQPLPVQQPNDFTQTIRFVALHQPEVWQYTQPLQAAGLSVCSIRSHQDGTDLYTQWKNNHRLPASCALHPLLIGQPGLPCCYGLALGVLPHG